MKICNGIFFQSLIKNTFKNSKSYSALYSKFVSISADHQKTKFDHAMRESRTAVP